MSKQSEQLPSVSAYAVVPGDEKEQEVPEYTVVEGTAVLDEPATNQVADTKFAHLPETKGLAWRDDFFGDDFDDIVAVFDFDYEGMESHYKCVSWGCLGVSAFCLPSLLPWMLLSLVPCYLNKNVRWNVRAQHIALTHAGILFVHDTRQACWGEPCCIVSKRTKFIPYEEIAECVVTDGNTKTCSVRNKLTKVTIDTASPRHTHDLEVLGLEHPHAFQKLVMAMKYAVHPAAASSRLAVVMDRGLSNNNSEDVAVLLREIRDELRQNNDAIRSMQTPSPSLQPSAPSEE